MDNLLYINLAIFVLSIKVSNGMDAVITYVDGLDPVWQKEYERVTKIPVMDKRFRDWGTLKYLLRGIETKMPFVKNVYLVVSHESQVPQWADTAQLKIVLHRDIIPQAYLPTFNSTTIEMFLHKIPGLDEQFLYFNDDMYPVMDCKETDFFRGDKIVFGFSHHCFAFDMYKKQCRSGDRLARKLLNLPSSWHFVRPQHTCTPMLKSACEYVFDHAQDEILHSLSALREDKNFNQYIFPDYLYYKGQAIREKQSKKHFSVAIATPNSIRKFLHNPTRKMVCINDVKLSKQKYDAMRTAILTSFDYLFPQKSRFEL